MGVPPTPNHRIALERLMVFWELTSGKFSHNFFPKTDVRFGDEIVNMRLYTERYCYSIRVSWNAREGEPEGWYFGGFMGVRTPRPTEDWSRGNDMADGDFTFETWQKILRDIVSNELLDLGEFIDKEKYLEGIPSQIHINGVGDSIIGRNVMNKVAVGKSYQQWRGEATEKRDHKLLNILDRGWELNVIKQTMNALNTGDVFGIQNKDFARELSEFLKQRSSSMNRIAVARELVEIAKLITGTTGTFKCPECGTKVLENTGYCVKCQKKVKQAQWETLPTGWTKASLKSFYDNLAGGGDAKKKFYSCVEKIGDTDITSPEKFCGSLLDQFMDPSWRGVGR